MSSPLHPIGIRICLLLSALPAIAAAQDPSFFSRGTSCAPAGTEDVRVTGAQTRRGSNTYTVTTTGRGRATGVLLQSLAARPTPLDLRSRGMPGCSEWIGSRATGLPFQFDSAGQAQMTFQLPTSLFETTVFHQAFVVLGGINAANLVSSNLLILDNGNTNLTVAEIARFAPIVRIHPADDYRPMSPDVFINLSRFRHHRGWQSDQGFHRTSLEWVTTDSHDSVYYNVPDDWLNCYALHANGQNRRPRDGNCGDSYNVFLQPSGRPTGPLAPTGVVPAYYHYRRVGERHEVQYWWFCGFNDSVATFNHQGDWEHVTVHIVNRTVVGVYFAAHEGGDYVATGEGLRFVGTHPLVYMAKGSHASYRTTGIWHYGADFTCDGGPEWDTSQLLRSLGTQPWKDYAGAWGEVGAIATTTGPLGPWHKRDNP